MGLFLGDSEPSKIFVGDTQISKVFLGDTQVRPSGGGVKREYSYDFTTGSMADFSADGWTIPAEYTIDSTGLRCSDNWQNITMGNITSLNDALQTATTVEMKLVWSKSVDYCDYVLVMNNEDDSSYNVIYGNGYWTEFQAGNVALLRGDNKSHPNNTEFTSALSINLSTGACEYSDTVGIGGTGTIDNTAISRILTLDALRLSINTDGRIKSMQVIVS